MRGLPFFAPILINSLILNTGARMLDSFYHMTLKLFRNSFLLVGGGGELLEFCHMLDVS